MCGDTFAWLISQSLPPLLCHNKKAIVQSPNGEREKDMHNKIAFLLGCKKQEAGEEKGKITDTFLWSQAALGLLRKTLGGGGGRSDLLFFRVGEIEVWNGFCFCTIGKRKLGRVNRRRRRFRTGRRHPPVYLLLDRGSRSQLRSSSDPPEIEAKKKKLHLLLFNDSLSFGKL